MLTSITHQVSRPPQIYSTSLLPPSLCHFPSCCTGPTGPSCSFPCRPRTEWRRSRCQKPFGKIQHITGRRAPVYSCLKGEPLVNGASHRCGWLSLVVVVVVEVLLYVHRNRRFIKDGSPGRPLLKCYFTSTETVGLLRTEAQDVHLDFHTALEF